MSREQKYHMEIFRLRKGGLNPESMGIDTFLKYDEKPKLLQTIKELENKVDNLTDELSLMKEQNESKSMIQAEDLRKEYYEKLVENSTVDLAKENL